MDRKEIILLVVVVLLVVTAAIQTVQLVRLGNSPVVAGSASSSVPLSSDHGSSSGGSSLDDLPSMVGGC